MLRKIVYLLLFFALLFQRSLHATHTAPLVTNFGPQKYAASGQNWAIAQDWNGIMFFGNNRGLLIYNGAEWQLLPFGDGTHTVRSLYADPDTRRIYVGSLEEFGYYKQSPEGKWHYTSLSDMLKNYTMQNDEVWNIIQMGSSIYFQTFASYFVYDGNTVEAFKNGDSYLFFFKTNGELYTDVRNVGLSRYSTKEKCFTRLDDLHFDSRVVNMFTTQNEKTYIITENHGIYCKEENKVHRIDKNTANWPIANRALLTHDSLLLVGSIGNGLYAYNLEGSLQWVLSTTSNGLQNNTILNLFEDKNGDIWLALDKGISLVHLTSPLRSFIVSEQHIGSVTGAIEYKNKLFLASNTGLFSLETEDNKNPIVKHIPQISGQIWSAATFDQQPLFFGSQKGYTISASEKIVPIAEISGGMCMVKSTLYDQEVLIQGSFSDVCIYRKDNEKRWQYSHHIENFLQPIKTIETDHHNNIWLAHLHKGMYQLRLDKSLTHIESSTYYPALGSEKASKIDIYKLGNRVVFTDHKQFYIYNDIDQTIIPYTSLNDQLGPFMSSSKISQGRDDLYWFIKDNMAALVHFYNETLTFIDFVNYNTFNADFMDLQQSIIPLNDGSWLFCLDNGYAKYRQSKSPNNYSPRLQWSKIAVKHDNDSIELLPIFPNNQINIASSATGVAFYVSYPGYTQQHALHTSYHLKGENSISTMPNLSYPITYSALPHGSYTLYVNLYNEFDTLLDTIEYKFIIEPPIYLTPWAKTSYIGVFLLLLYGIYVLIERYLAHKREEIEANINKQKSEIAQRQQEEIIQLRNQNLENEIIFKSKELANYSRQDMERNELLENIRTELMHLKLGLGTGVNSKKQFDKLLNIINENVSTEKKWQTYQENFDLIHEHFFRNLRATYPDLTPNDLRLCAYLRLNYTSKEIAQLLHISIKGVEVARYRLRKKLNLDPQKGIVEFLIDQK